MARGYLLDTGVANLIALRDETTSRYIAPLSPIYIPNIVFGEMQFGAYWHAYRHQSQKYLDIYDDFIKRYRSAIISPNLATAYYYGAIYAELKTKGQLIQQNDVWIASLALQYQLTLLTKDKDYERISGLNLQGL